MTGQSMFESLRTQQSRLAIEAETEPDKAAAGAFIRRRGGADVDLMLAMVLGVAL
jgi:hypothetical protein